MIHTSGYKRREVQKGEPFGGCMWELQVKVGSDL